MSYNDRVDYKKIEGKTIIEAVVNEARDRIDFTCSDGTTFIMYHSQDCCESVSIEDIAGDLSDLYGSPILLAEENVSREKTEEQKKQEYQDDSFTWTFYTLRNINATVQIRWFGESNGYYSESVDFEMFEPEKPTTH